MGILGRNSQAVGCVNSPLEHRRGTYGIYQQPSDILSAIPSLKLVEMIRIETPLRISLCGEPMSD